MSGLTMYFARILINWAELGLSHRTDWAKAMREEAEFCDTAGARLRWSFGCWIASLRVTGVWLYPLALAAAVTALAVREWVADEGLPTYVMLFSIALALGLLRPKRVVVSGVASGIVVTAVLTFETLSGLHPAYETVRQTLWTSADWLVLIVPGLAGASVGSWMRREFHKG